MKLRTLTVAALTFLSITSSSAFSESDPLAGGSPAPADKSTITVGSADFPESQLLATIYAKALSAKGLKVETRMNIGSREVYFPALADGSIDLLPEYGGAALRYLDKASTQNASDEVYAALQNVLPKGVALLAASSAQDTNTVAVTRATAEKYNLKAIGDLKQHAPEFTLGGPPEWKVRPEGVPGFEKTYGLKFKSYKTLDVCGPLVLAALANGQINVGCMFSTDPSIKTHDLVTLADPENLIPSQNIVPLIAQAKVTDSVAAALNAVSAALTTEDLIVLNGRVASHESYEAIAEDWLKQHKLD